MLEVLKCAIHDRACEPKVAVHACGAIVLRSGFFIRADFVGEVRDGVEGE